MGHRGRGEGVWGVESGRSRAREGRRNHVVCVIGAVGRRGWDRGRDAPHETVITCRPRGNAPLLAAARLAPPRPTSPCSGMSQVQALRVLVTAAAVAGATQALAAADVGEGLQEGWLESCCLPPMRFQRIGGPLSTTLTSDHSCTRA
eukprot:1158528-Pelagomonas_calceolata.AAC.2